MNLLREISRTALLAAAAAWAPAAHAQLWTNGGKDFPFGQYTVLGATSDIQRVAADGFNIIHTYGFGPGWGAWAEEYLERAANAGIYVAFPIGDETYIPPVTPENVQHFAEFESLAWWYNSPEEIYYWEPAQYEPFKQRSAIIRANDPLDRPIFNYWQNGYTAQGLTNFTPYLDVIGAGAYANYLNKPRPWVRWQVEQEVQAIAMNGNPPGQFAMGILQMYPGELYPEAPPMTGADAYHDVYLSLVSGAKGIFVYGDYYRNDADPAIYQAYSKAAKELNGAQRLGEVFVFGTNVASGALRANITSGPLKSQAFRDVIGSETQGNLIQYDSISQRVLAYHDHVYLSAVNSAASPVSATFPGVRANDGETGIDVLFESRTVPISGTSFSDSFNAIGVHNYRLPRSADLILREEKFNSASAWTARYGNGSITTVNGIATIHRGSAVEEYFNRALEPGSVPEGGFLELKINAPTDTQFRLFVVDPDWPSPPTVAEIPWQSGTGDWQTIRQQMAGDWMTSNDAVWLGIRGGSSFQVDSLGIYFRAISTQMGDTDFDGDVDLADLGALATSYGQSNDVFWRDGDFDGDGDVDLADLGTLATHYGAGQAQAFADFQTLVAVPEPAATIIPVFVLFRLLTKRRGFIA